MSRTLAALATLALVAGCTVAPNSQVMVRGAGPDDLLKLRSGPGLNYDIIMGLPDGTRLNRGTCAPANGTTWCRVTLAASPRVSGYVSAEYLGVI
ncbi:SH3 domain-containing protein [Paracoccus sp. TK19116]|uniref:SH3 domain-containing protein n=1 Tax=Paracoccus albicereus TaxID=2922394 RepID=A0ABT1MQW4_9RHOB|nr:SH3 domain-containing protein [Paracoccus albicereus]MCQ0969723.1 SH3 domain-containing protein [Paracoccus albicereus]